MGQIPQSIPRSWGTAQHLPAPPRSSPTLEVSLTPSVPSPNPWDCASLSAPRWERGRWERPGAGKGQKKDKIEEKIKAGCFPPRC